MVASVSDSDGLHARIVRPGGLCPASTVKVDARDEVGDDDEVKDDAYDNDDDDFCGPTYGHGFSDTCDAHDDHDDVDHGNGYF